MGKNAKELPFVLAYAVLAVLVLWGAQLFFKTPTLPM